LKYIMEKNMKGKIFKTEKHRAVRCVSSARRDLCGGCWVTGIPSATNYKNRRLIMRKYINTLLFLIILTIHLVCNHTDKITVKSQITCIHTNTYLLYSEQSREAAVIDAAGPIDILLNIVKEKIFLMLYEEF